LALFLLPVFGEVEFFFGVLAELFLAALRAIKELRNFLTALIVLEDVLFFSLRGKMVVLRLGWYVDAR
jgi:hypothetical protein